MVLTVCPGAGPSEMIEAPLDRIRHGKDGDVVTTLFGGAIPQSQGVKPVGVHLIRLLMGTFGCETWPAPNFGSAIYLFIYRLYLR